MVNQSIVTVESIYELQNIRNKADYIVLSQGNGLYYKLKLNREEEEEKKEEEEEELTIKLKYLSKYGRRQ